MAMPDVVTREQWLEERKDLLVKEKQATRARDALNEGSLVLLVWDRLQRRSPGHPDQG